MRNRMHLICIEGFLAVKVTFWREAVSHQCAEKVQMKHSTCPYTNIVATVMPGSHQRRLYCYSDRARYWKFSVLTWI